MKEGFFLVELSTVLSYLCLSIHFDFRRNKIRKASLKKKKGIEIGNVAAISTGQLENGFSNSILRNFSTYVVEINECLVAEPDKVALKLLGTDQQNTEVGHLYNIPSRG